MKKLMIMTSLIFLAACAEAQVSEMASDVNPEVTSEVERDIAKTEHPDAPEQTAAQRTDSAIFAGGCFWCVEADFEKLPGVIEAVSGYTGGHTENPTYKEVTHKKTGHYEAVKVTYNPSKVSYGELVDYFWVHVDPTDPYGQFCDKGDSYRSAIFARPDQLAAANQSKSHVINVKPFQADIVTPVLPVSEFYDAERYHQDYYKKNKFRYKLYRNGCGRDKRIKSLWGAKR